LHPFIHYKFPLSLVNMGSPTPSSRLSIYISSIRLNTNRLSDSYPIMGDTVGPTNNKSC